MTDNYLRRIDDTLVREVTSKTYVDIRPKGRGLTKEGIKSVSYTHLTLPTKA